jgi:hypothetical protein
MPVSGTCKENIKGKKFNHKERKTNFFYSTITISHIIARERNNLKQYKHNIE